MTECRAGPRGCSSQISVALAPRRTPPFRSVPLRSIASRTQRFAPCAPDPTGLAGPLRSVLVCRMSRNLFPVPEKMPWFTKYVEGLVKSVNVFFQDRTRCKQRDGAPPSSQRKPSSTASSSSLSLLSSARRSSSRKRARTALEVTSCTGRRIVGRESVLDADLAAQAPRQHEASKRLASSASAARLGSEEAQAVQGQANFTEDDFRQPPTVAYPKAREGSLYSLLLVDLKGHNSLRARSHRLAWVQHNIPGAAFARGDISAGAVCTPYRAPCCRRGSLHVLVLVFEQRQGAPLFDVSPVFAEDCLRLSTWLSRFGSSARRMVVCEEFRAHVQRSPEDATDSDSCSSSSVELEMPTVSFHKLESPKRPKTATTAFVFSEQNGWVPVSACSLASSTSRGRPLDESPCVSPKECPKRIKVF
ncbi:39S ribosomal protein L38, mitochondrial [Frankliniella fusca]|uniref:39S ribosomal protein L38, mitochondrial n=1 Tax=Frankliniella fusca TaxID=407009 RepID=A0AAE1LPR3_9NEOP|nr:39S ribosomal protein L38, mitochondrial [Frankliniella fusca]